MNKNEIRAIRALPEEYVIDGTCICTFDESVVVMNALLPPIRWRPETGFETIVFETVGLDPVPPAVQTDSTMKTRSAQVDTGDAILNGIVNPKGGK